MERFRITYHVGGTEGEAYSKALDLCVEQTVEFPRDLLPEGFIKDDLVARIESFVPDWPTGSRVSISFAVDTIATEFTQLLNVIFGNISILPGYRVEELVLPESIIKNYRGPRFGRIGLRSKLGIAKRPLLFTALKPMGLSSSQLADLAYKFALGGIDIIKDDHGLTNQTFAPFTERVKLCAEAVQKANQETGRRSIYVANVTAPIDDIFNRAKYAQEQGAGGLLVAPGLVGFDTMRKLADDDEIALPIISHPAFLGSFVTSPEQGVSHFVLFGQMMRLAGADAVIYPNYGGRFSFSRPDCKSIVTGTSIPMGHLKSIFPCPGGGMSVSNIPDLMQVYGHDVAFLIGGGLFAMGPDILENSRYFHNLVEKISLD